MKQHKKYELKRKGAQDQQGHSDVPLPSNVFQLLISSPEVVPGQMIYTVPPVNLGSIVGSPLPMACDPQRRGA